MKIVKIADMAWWTRRVKQVPERNDQERAEAPAVLSEKKKKSQRDLSSKSMKKREKNAD